MYIYLPKKDKSSVAMLLTTTFFAIILILSVFVSSVFSIPMVNAQSSLPSPIIPGLSDVNPNGDFLEEQSQGIPFVDSLTGSLVTQNPHSQPYPYPDPYQTIPSPTQTLPGDTLSLEEQQLLQENSVVDLTVPETIISSIVDGNNVQLQEGDATTSNKVVLTIQGTDDSAVSSFQCVLDNIQQDPSICSTNPIVAENLPPGAHLFQISSVDSAGNVDATPAFFSWNVVVSNQYSEDQQIPQQLQQQQQPMLPLPQLPILQLQEQTMLPYQTNISPFITPVPNNSNGNATTIHENQQMLQSSSSQGFQAANPILVPPQFYTTDPYQLPLDAQQYQNQQNLQQPLQSSAQNTSSLKQPLATSSLSRFQVQTYDSSQLQPQPQIMNNNTTPNSESTQNQNQLLLETQSGENQEEEIQVPTNPGVTLAENTTSSSQAKLTDVPIVSIANSTDATINSTSVPSSILPTTTATNNTNTNSQAFATDNNSSALAAAELPKTTEPFLTCKQGYLGLADQHCAPPDAKIIEPCTEQSTLDHQGFCPLEGEVDPINGCHNIGGEQYVVYPPNPTQDKKPTANPQPSGTCFRPDLCTEESGQLVCSLEPPEPDPCPPPDTQQPKSTSVSQLDQPKCEDDYVKQALEKLCLDPNTDFTKFTKRDWILLNKAITGAYAQLYLSNPDAFKWAGMAAYASDLVGDGMRASSGITKLLFPDNLFDALSNGNLALYKEIAWQHEAYLSEGITALERIFQEGGLEPAEEAVLNSWKQIDQGIKTGNSQLIWQGNAGLLEYEQKVFLQQVAYDPHRNMWKIVTNRVYIPTKSPIPGDTTTFVQYMKMNSPNVTPDLGDPDQRWNWIENSMLPKYKDLETKRPAKVGLDLTKYAAILLRNICNR